MTLSLLKYCFIKNIYLKSKLSNPSYKIFTTNALFSQRILRNIIFIKNLLLISKYQNLHNFLWLNPKIHQYIYQFF